MRNAETGRWGGFKIMKASEGNGISVDRNVLKQAFGLFIRSMKTNRKSLEEAGTDLSFRKTGRPAERSHPLKGYKLIGRET